MTRYIVTTYLVETSSKDQEVEASDATEAARTALKREDSWGKLYWLDGSYHGELEVVALLDDGRAPETTVVRVEDVVGTQ
jgi:hypothetical protein